jgi:hypothetical protein
MKLEITVPESLKEISLKDYQTFVKVAQSDSDETFIRQKMIQIFCHVPLLAVTKMKHKDFQQISGHLSNIIKEQPSLTPIIEIEGKPYGFIPSLQEDMTVGEFTDLDGFMKDWKDFHKAMAVLYRPTKIQRKGKYQIIDYEPSEERNALMLNLSMDVVMGAVLFFWSLSAQLLKITPKSLERQLRKNPKSAAALEKNGVGISTFITSLEEVCLRLETLLPYTLGLRYYSSHTKKS